MTKFLPLALLSAGALLSGSAAFAATTRPAAKPATTMAAKPAMTAARPAATAAAKPRMVTAKLANGKTVTYNCALAGNATKTACKHG